MLQGKKAYICSPLSAPNPEGVQHNMELAKYYLMQMKRLYHCRTFASHAHLPLMLDDRIPEERETAMQIAVLMLDLCEVYRLLFLSPSMRYNINKILSTENMFFNITCPCTLNSSSPFRHFLHKVLFSGTCNIYFVSRIKCYSEIM